MTDPANRSVPAAGVGAAGPVGPDGRADSPGPSSRRRQAMLLLRMFGLLVGAAAVYLCVRTLVRQWPTIRLAVLNANVWLLLLGLLASVAGTFALAVSWHRCLAVLGERVPLLRATGWFYAGELGKYLPGGIWPVVGRGELARRGGVSRTLAYTSTLLAMGLMCVGAAVACGLVSPFLLMDGGDDVGWAWILLLMIPVGVIVVHPSVLGKIFALAGRATKGRFQVTAPPWGAMIGLIAISAVPWIFIGLAAVAVTAAFGYEQQPGRIIFAAVAAWIIGFLAVPVPAGAGVRELIFVSLCGLAAGPAVAVATTTRLCLIVVDAVGGLTGLIAQRKRPVAAAEQVPGDSPDPPSTRDSPSAVSLSPTVALSTVSTATTGERQASNGPA